MPLEIKKTHFGASWHDIVNPTLDDLRDVNTLTELTPALSEVLLLPSLRPRLEIHGQALFVALHFPNYDPVRQLVRPEELDIVITKQAVVTAHYKPLPFLQEFARELDSDEAPASKSDFVNTAYLIKKLLTHIAAFQQRQLDHIESDIRELEDNALEGDDSVLVRRLAVLRRNIINFRHILKPQQHTFENLTEAIVTILGKNNALFIAPILGEYKNIREQLDTHAETLAALQDTRFALLNVRTNQIMALFSVIAVVVVTFSAMPLIFDMYPGLSNDTRWLIILEIALLGTLVITYLKQRRLL